MNYLESNNALFELFWPTTRDHCNRVFGYVPKSYWPDRLEDGTAPVDRVWLRVSRKTVLEKLAGFGEGNGQSVKRYDVTGLLYIQLFCPQSLDDPQIVFPQLAQVIKDSLEGKNDPSNELWTRTVTITELPSEKSWFRKNVVVEFTYQEIKR